VKNASTPAQPVEEQAAAPDLRVGIVSDDEIRLRRAVSGLDLAGLAVAAQVARVSDLRKAVGKAALGAAVIVVDRLGDEQVSSLRAVRKAFPQLPVICLAASLSPRDVREALSAGADGLVLEEAAETSLALAVRSACAGHLFLPRQFGTLFAKPVLSAREKQILGMVVMGFSNGEIASRLYLAEATVKTHLSSAFGKLGVRSRSEAANLILDPGAGLGTGILAIVGDEERIGPSV
jgi:DNA-binding NarL/FixJ family response regulator